MSLASRVGPKFGFGVTHEIRPLPGKGEGHPTHGLGGPPGPSSAVRQVRTSVGSSYSVGWDLSPLLLPFRRLPSTFLDSLVQLSGESVFGIRHAKGVDPRRKSVRYR